MFKTYRTPREDGFLLGEALIALSILVVGLMAVSEAIAASHRARIRAENGALLAACAQGRLVSMVAGSEIQQEACASIVWTDELVPVSPQLVRTITKASSGTGKRAREELFETVTATP